MPNPSFPNEYQARQVKESDSKACTLCYKPTSTVLLAANNADFFYVCPTHLQDETFANPIYPQAYKDLATEKTNLESKISRTKQKAELNKPYAWTKIMSAVGYSKSSTKQEPEPSSKDNEVQAKDAGKETYESICKELKDLQNELNGVKERLTNYLFKKYTLDEGIYRIRINNHNKARLKATQDRKMQEKLLNPSLFPSVPTQLPQ